MYVCTQFGKQCFAVVLVVVLGTGRYVVVGVKDMYLEAGRDTVHSCVTRPSDGSGRREKKRREKKRKGRV